MFDIHGISMRGNGIAARATVKCPTCARYSDVWLRIAADVPEVFMCPDCGDMFAAGIQEIIVRPSVYKVKGAK